MGNKPTLWDDLMLLLFPIDNEEGGGYGGFKLEGSEINLVFDPCFMAHDAGYQDILDGVSLITLKQLDRAFLRNCLKRAAWYGWQTSSTANLVKYTRYAWEMYRVVRAWALTIRRPLERWRPGDGPLKDKYVAS